MNKARGSPDVVRAQQCDDAGQHYDAVNHLVAGTRKNDLEAMTRLGKRLLVGDRAPHRPNDGARLLADASARGGAEAAALAAVLLGVGAYVEHDLDAALDSLARAAERGWVPAQKQMAVLADAAPSEWAQEPAAHAGDWPRMAAAIDIASWRKAPSGISLNESPLVRTFPGFVNASICRWLIERSRRRLSRSLVYDPNVHKVTVHETRTNTAAMFNLLEADLVSVLVQTRIAACLNVPFRYLEPVNVLHYDEGEQISEHYDFVDPDSPDYEAELVRQGQRVVTFLVYLNDGYVGGETEFPRLGITYKGKLGEGLYFVNALPDNKPDRRALHAGRPTTRGEKWIVSQFIRSRPTF